MDGRQQASWAERVLVERLSGGDETALAELYDRYSGFVYGLALRVLTDRRAAGDVTQDVFVTLWEQPESIGIQPGRGTLRGFLGALAHRRAVDALRRQRDGEHPEAPASVALPGPVGADEADGPEPAEAVTRSDATRKVYRALELVPEAQRRALELAYFHGYTYRQVADALGIPEGTVKSRLRQALVHIAETLGPELSARSERWA